MLIAGCASNAAKPLEAPAGTSASAPTTSTAVEVPAETPEPEPSPVEAPPVPDPAASEPQTIEDPESEDESVVVIDTGAKDVTERPETLVEAARRERQRRQLADPTDIVITDKTLSEYATGELTVAEPTSSPATGELIALESETAQQEAYWRGRALAIRRAWRDAYDRIPELEEKVFELRQAFYREDDGFYRDGEIKPAWDRAIEQLEEARLEVEARQEELVVFLEEGREAGALPGWLREGIDLEPDPLTVEEPSAEPAEPVIYQQEPSDPPS